MTEARLFRAVLVLVALLAFVVTVEFGRFIENNKILPTGPASEFQ